MKYLYTILVILVTVICLFSFLITNNLQELKFDIVILLLITPFCILVDAVDINKSSKIGETYNINKTNRSEE